MQKQQNAHHIHNTGEGDFATQHYEKQSSRAVFPVEDGSNPKGETEPVPSSLLQEGKFFSRLLTRESSKGFSTRTYYRAEGKVPFEWEIAPGKPKNPSETAHLLLLSPPPSVHRHLAPQNRHHEKTRFWFLNSIGRKTDVSRPIYGSCISDAGQSMTIKADAKGDLPASGNVFRRLEFASNGCLPFDLSSVFGSTRRRLKWVVEKSGGDPFGAPFVAFPTRCFHVEGCFGVSGGPHRTVNTTNGS